MIIHLCIESTNTGRLEETLESIKQYSGLVTYQMYSLTLSSVKSIWEVVSCFNDNVYLLFLKEGDKLMSLDFLDSLCVDVDMYLLSNIRAESYPNINTSPFSLSNFYEGRYSNHNFLIKAKQLDRIKPNLSFGKAWVMDVVLSVLFANNGLAKELYANVLTPNSPSLIDVVGDRDIILKVIPAKYGYSLNDMLVISQSKAKHKYRKILKRKIKQLSLNIISLWLKNIACSKEYKQFYRTVFFKSKYVRDWKQIPVIINNFNRLSYLTQLIESLEKRGVTNIHILDNNSTYVPLLEFYKTTPYSVYHLGSNLGFRALWKSEVYDLFKDDYYVYTDPDLKICDECPDNFMEHFMSLHKKYNTIWKVGFSLNTCDLPEHFSKRREVQHWEQQFQEIEIEQNVFYAPIDTTFAIYKPFGISDNERSLRMAGKYGMHHLPWYIDSEHLSVEDVYYVNNCAQLTHWTVFK